MSHLQNTLVPAFWLSLKIRQNRARKIGRQKMQEDLRVIMECEYPQLRKTRSSEMEHLLRLQSFPSSYL